MDLIVALEMSRLQMIKDAQQKKKYYFIFIKNNNYNYKILYLNYYLLLTYFVRRSENEEASCSKYHTGKSIIFRVFKLYLSRKKK